MRSSELRRSSSPRRRRPRGLLWTLLGLFGLGLLATLLAGRKRSFPELGPELEPETETDLEPTPESLPETDLAVRETAGQWIPGPAGNLYVRDEDGEVHPGALPVLFVHSLAGNGGQWALQLDHLHRHRRAVALDLRGHGDSDPAEDGDYSIQALAADVAAVADQLRLRRFLLAGHSLGATVAIEYAGHHPDRVAGLLLVDPNGDQSRVPAEQARSFLDALRSDPVGELDSYFRQLVMGGDRHAGRWVLEDVRFTDETAIVECLESSIRYSPLPALERYKGPKLSIISSMNDLPYSLHRLLPDLPVRLMPGTGHWLMMDRPEMFNHLLDEFLEQVEARAGGPR
jgi:pimeloyl-ACP methyl ester carboxylesterase